MILRNRLHLSLLLSSAVGVAAVASSACGGISDPTKGGSEGRVATVSGALTGVTVPANARVALVYRKVTTDAVGTHGSVEVASDVAVVSGKFTMNLGIPADDYFTTTDASSIGNVSASPPSSEVLPAPAPTTGSGTSGGTSTSGSPGAFGSSQLTPRDIVSGGITEPLSAAIAGFVVYADTNGNGKLDLEGDYASSPDQILGGNKELILVYLKGGGSLDYEKLRDKSGILPTTGFDLAWSQGRWLPLTDVELKLTANAQLPSTVCEKWISATGSSSGGSVSSDPTVSDSSGTSGSAGVATTSDGGTSTGSGSSGGGSSGGFPSSYPSPSDPNLHCSPDGRSYTYGGGDTMCQPAPPQPTGLCAGDVYATPTVCAGSTGYGNALASDAPVPDGWPCATGLDGGAADASVDGGAFDGGSFDAGSGDGGL